MYPALHTLFIAEIVLSILSYPMACRQALPWNIVFVLFWFFVFFAFDVLAFMIACLKAIRVPLKAGRGCECKQREEEMLKRHDESGFGEKVC